MVLSSAPTSLARSMYPIRGRVYAWMQWTGNIEKARASAVVAERHGPVGIGGFIIVAL